MKRLLLTSLAILGASTTLQAQDAPPKGEVTKYTFSNSKIFPGTTRDYWVYVPKQYDPATPACLHVNQDGIQNKAPEVFDRLIAAREIPVVIGVFIRPGEVKAIKPDALDRYNRSYEYDGLGDAYARFLLEELLPDVEKKTTADGKPIKLSKTPRSGSSAARRAAPSRRSRRPGNAPTPSDGSSARSERMSASEGETSTPP